MTHTISGIQFVFQSFFLVINKIFFAIQISLCSNRSEIGLKKFKIYRRLRDFLKRADHNISPLKICELTHNCISLLKNVLFRKQQNFQRYFHQLCLHHNANLQMISLCTQDVKSGLFECLPFCHCRTTPSKNIQKPVLSEPFPQKVFKNGDFSF